MSSLNNPELHEVEIALAPLYTSPRRTTSHFVRTLTQLIRSRPEVMDLALKVDQADGPDSFLIITFQKVFNYTLVYQHKAYQPYYPESTEELEKIVLILQKHFSDIAPKMVSIFHRLSGIHTQSSNEVLAALMRPKVPAETAQAKLAEPKSKRQSFNLEMDDLPVTEEPLQWLWQKSRSARQVIWPEAFRRGFHSWAMGILDSMYITNLLYHGFQKNEQIYYQTSTGDKLRPWHRLVRILLGAEYYWHFNRRSVEVDPGMNMLDASKAQQEHIYRIYEELLRPLPDEHEAVSEMNRRNWKLERIKGTRQSPRVQCRYVDPQKAYQVEFSANTISVKEIRLAALPDAVTEGVAAKPKKVDVKPSKVPEHRDPGIKEDIAWTLYMSQKLQPEWSKEFAHQEDFPSWARGLLSGMKASFTLYDYFAKTANRSKVLNSGVTLQPHHRIVRILVAAEYFWLFNSRDTDLPEDLSIQDAKEMFQRHVGIIYDHFVNLLPENHPAIQGENALIERSSWRIERTRGTRRSNRVVFKYWDAEGHWMVECGATSISVRKWTEGEE